MKRIIKNVTLILSIAAVIFMLAACKSEKIDDKDTKPSIICTAFPQYDWVKEIVGDRAQNFDIALLNDNGVDMHSFQPSVDDIVKIGNSKLVISVGAVSEKWLDDALNALSGAKPKHVKLIEAIGEGRQLGLDGHICTSEHEHDHSSEIDEHVWLSLENAKEICCAITANIVDLDSDNADYYNERLAGYIERLDALTERLDDGIKNSSKKTLIFADRFPFRYLLNDFEIGYYAAFDGCSSDSEASFETIAFLAGKLDELELSYVITVDGSDGKLAETVISNTDTKVQKILTLNSMQSVNRSDIENGASYLGIMEANIDTVVAALE